MVVVRVVRESSLPHTTGLQFITREDFTAICGVSPTNGKPGREVQADSLNICLLQESNMGIERVRERKE